MDTIKAFLERWDILGFVVAGLIGAIIMLLIDGIKSLFSMKRKKYCISKSLMSSTVYHQTNKDGLRISISFNDNEIEGPLTILKIRLRNDGEDDIMYSQKISQLMMIVETMDVLDVSVDSEIEGINPTVKTDSCGVYNIKWELLKRDEFFYIIVIAKGEIEDMSGVKFGIRADGINQIKTPEYKVSDTIIPVWGAMALIVIPVILFWPANDMFLDVFPMKWFLVGSMFILALVFWIGALKQRIRWMREG